MRRFIQCALGACVIAATVILSLAGMPLQCPEPHPMLPELISSPPTAPESDSVQPTAAPATKTGAEYELPNEDNDLEEEDVSVAASSDAQPTEPESVVPSS